MGSSAETWQIGEHSVEVSHLDKLFWTEPDFTKGDMLRYYRDIAPTILPPLHERPVTLRVFPEGGLGESYYQRARPEYAPDWLRSVPYRPKTGRPASASSSVTPLPLIDDAAGLVWFANAGAIEFHTWGAQLPDLTRPDQAIFDLDPGEEVSFGRVLEAAMKLHGELTQVGLDGYPKTSGGHGLHVVIPLATGPTFEEVRAWVKGIAERLAERYPKLLAVAHGGTHSGSHVTIDYAQNSVGRNTAAPYTLRGRSPQPLVSTPLTWDEVAAGKIQPTECTPDAVLERVQRLGDLFAAAQRRGQQLPAQKAP